MSRAGSVSQTAPKGVKVRKSAGEIVFSVVNAAILVICCALCLIPVLYIIAASFSSGAALDANKVFLWPVEFTTSAYRLLFTATDLVRYFLNSCLLTGVGTAICVVVTVLCAYPLSKSYLYGKRVLTLLMTFTMVFSGGMIPEFILIRKLGLMDSYWSIWLSGAMTTYNMFIMRSFFDSIPKEMDESAKIDGCGEWRLLLQIYLPLSKASLATIGLFYGVDIWNMYQKVMLYISDTKKYTLPVFIQQTIFQLQLLTSDSPEAASLNATDIVSESVQSAGVVVLIVPMLLIYPFLQKYFVKGVTLGAVKG